MLMIPFDIELRGLSECGWARSMQLGARPLGVLGMFRNDSISYPFVVFPEEPLKRNQLVKFKMVDFFSGFVALLFIFLSIRLAVYILC